MALGNIECQRASIDWTGLAMSELDERKAAILRAIVEHYVDNAQPVGSQTVTQSAGPTPKTATRSADLVPATLIAL